MTATMATRMSALSTADTFAVHNSKPVAGLQLQAGRSHTKYSSGARRQQHGLRFHQSGIERLKATQQGMASTRGRVCAVSNIWGSEVQEETNIPQPEESGVTRPTLTVLDVKLMDGPLEGELTVQGSLDVERLDENKVFDLLTDHESSHEIFRTILDVETAYQDDGSIRLFQNCRWSFFVFAGSFPVELEVMEDRPNRSFTFRDVRQGGMMKKMAGSWTVGPSETIPGGVLVEHTLTVKMAINVPPPFGGHTNKIFLSQVKEILTDLQLALEKNDSELVVGPVVSAAPSQHLSPEVPPAQHVSPEVPPKHVTAPALASKRKARDALWATAHQWSHW